MRVLVLTVALALFAGVAMANEADTDAEVAVPTLPGQGSGCLTVRSKRDYTSRKWHAPRKIVGYNGKCVAASACPGERSVHGQCAGIDVVCCRTPQSFAKIEAKKAAKSAMIPVTTFGSVLRGAPGQGCIDIGGACGEKSQCTGTVRTGLCPGASNIACCVKGGVQPPQPPVGGRSMSSLISIPAGINSGLNFPSADFQIAKIGRPGCPLTAACFSCNCATNNAVISRLRVTMKVTDTVSITGLKPFVEAVQRAFANMKAAGGEALTAYQQAKSAGGLCCRPIKRSNGTPGGTWSNHSWGVAVDFFFGGSMDPRGDAKTQYGLSVMAPFFQREKLYWAAGYGGSSEDAMHFEASTQALNEWKAAGKL